jgi:hypothetical protein
VLAFFSNTANKKIIAGTQIIVGTQIRDVLSRAEKAHMHLSSSSPSHTHLLSSSGGCAIASGKSTHACILLLSLPHTLIVIIWRMCYRERKKHTCMYPPPLPPTHTYCHHLEDVLSRAEKAFHIHANDALRVRKHNTPCCRSSINVGEHRQRSLVQYSAV